PLGVPTLETGDVGADLNQLSPQYYSLGAALLQPTASGQTLGQTLRPYPWYQQVSADSDFAGDTYYNSLQTTVQLRLSSGSVGKQIRPGAGVTASIFPPPDRRLRAGRSPTDGLWPEAYLLDSARAAACFRLDLIDSNVETGFC